MRRTLALFAVLVLAACQDVGGPPEAPQTPSWARSAADPGIIPGRYIVLLQPGASRAAVAAEHGVTPERSYDRVVNGFAGPLSDEAVTRLQADPRVLLIEPDRLMRISETVQPNATWGLDRVDQRNLPLNTTYTYEGDGTGVVVHILDTGIRYDHVDFGGRASPGYDAFGGTGADCHGHGTHVAGTAGGTTWGVAKNVTLRAVRVLGCGGTGPTSGVIAGVNWVADFKAANPTVPMVANMSLGGPISSALDAAVTALIAAGVPTAVAAGNFDIDACTESPARTPDALTIGATGQNDARASFSNWGTCVDLFAPGVGITSAYFTSPTATATGSGTSQASPHVAGVAALYLQGNPAATGPEVNAAVIDATTKGIVTSAESPNNHLLFSRLDLVGPPPDPEPPVAAFAAQCNGATCSFFDASTGPPTSWDWDLGNGQTATTQNASATYALGTFFVTLTVSNALGSDDAAGIVTCTGGGRGGVSCAFSPGAPPDPEPPVAAFNGSCNGSSCNFTDASSGPPTSWSWDLGNGQTAGSPNASASYSAGTFTVTLTVSNAAGSDQATGTVTCVSGGRGGASCTFAPGGGGDPEPPVASFSKSCSGATCTFASTSSGNPTSFDWDLGNGQSASTPTASATYGVGSFTVTLTVSNDLGSDTANGTVSCTSSPRGGVSCN